MKYFKTTEAGTRWYRKGTASVKEFVVLVLETSQSRKNNF